MPYCFGEGDPGWDELDDDRLPRVSEFHYLPPPEVGGPPGPVHFGDELPPAASNSKPQPAPPAPRPADRGLLDRLLGRPPRTTPAAPEGAWQQLDAQRRREDEHRNRSWLALLAAAMREIGARRVYGRYDGGNDEGFAWLDHVELRSGERLAPDEAAARIAATDLAERLDEAQLWDSRWRREASDMRTIALDALAEECAVLLLGRGYGTGPFWLYGAFTVDLDACTIVDDRNAEPVVANIQIET